MKQQCSALLLMLYCLSPMALQAQTREVEQSMPARHEARGQEERLQRRERMRAIRQSLLEQGPQNAANRSGDLPVMNHSPGQGPWRAEGGGPGRGLRQLPPEERERLRREIREAARERPHP